MGVKHLKTCSGILYPFTWFLVIFQALSLKDESCNASIITCLKIAWAVFLAGGIIESLRVIEKYIRKTYHTKSKFFKNLVAAGYYFYLIFLFGLTIMFAILLSIIQDLCQNLSGLLWAIVIINGIFCFFVIVELLMGNKSNKSETGESLLSTDSPLQSNEYLGFNQV